MLGRGIMVGLQTRRIEFVALANGSGSSINHPIDLRTGDLIVVVANNVSGNAINTVSGAAWGQYDLSHSGTSTTIWWKFLTSIDIANTWISAASIQYCTLQYRAVGANTLTVKSDASTKGSGTQASFAGFPPSQISKGVLAVMTESGGGLFTSYPNDFTGRFSTNTGIQNGAIVATCYADQAIGYAGGTIGFTYASSPQWGMIVAEVT
jgi:hypothetical protein